MSLAIKGARPSQKYSSTDLQLRADFRQRLPLLRSRHFVALRRQRLRLTLRGLARFNDEGALLREASGMVLLQQRGIISTRILGRRTVPFLPFLIPHHVPRGFTQYPSTDRSFERTGLHLAVAVFVKLALGLASVRPALSVAFRLALALFLHVAELLAELGQGVEQLVLALPQTPGQRPRQRVQGLRGIVLDNLRPAFLLSYPTGSS